MDGHTCNTSPHKHFGCVANDVIKQLHMRRVQKVIMAGPVANICLESHMRDIIEAGFEVAMVRDAVAAGVNDEGDGYEAAMVNCPLHGQRYVDNRRNCEAHEGRGVRLTGSVIQAPAPCAAPRAS